MNTRWTEEQVARGDDQFVANGLRLSVREWLLVGGITLAVILFSPPAWKAVEPFEPEQDYRIPKALKTDYWLFDRWARASASRADILVVGDSVIWGEYVSPGGTLTHHLNRLAGEARFANLGLAGMHPAPLAGLVEHYGNALSGSDVILHCNLLWMSSPRHDLRDEKEFAFFHSDLVPQFFPRIPCYVKTDEERLAIVVRRNLRFSAWTGHLQIAYFTDPGDSEVMNIPAWTLKHPYRNPFGEVAFRWPHANTAYEIHDVDGIRTIRPPTPSRESLSWTERGIERTGFDWVDLESSFQWRSFRRTAKLLKERSKSLFVVVGPFNEHMLTEEGLARYRTMKNRVEAWLNANGIEYLSPDPPPGGLYADASHPLSEGYARIARQLFDHRFPE